MMLLVACGATTPSANDATPPGGSNPPPVGGPPPPSGPRTSDTSTKTFAIQKIFLGDVTRTDGAPDGLAWKRFGHNLDGKFTVASSNDVCTLPRGAPSSNQADGAFGIDNAFGAVVLPLLESAETPNAPSAQASAEYVAGKLTEQIWIKGLGDDPNETAIGLGGGVFPSLAYKGDSVVDVPFPGFGAATDWPVRVEGLADGATITGGPSAAFGDAYVASGTFVGRGTIYLPVSVLLFGVEVLLVIQHATLRFEHSAPGTAVNGTIAGVLDTEDLISRLKMASLEVSSTLCGSKFNAIVPQLRQASDIMRDLSNGAGVDCNAISIGLGFEATLIANPTQIAKNVIPRPPGMCK